MHKHECCAAHCICLDQDQNSYCEIPNKFFALFDPINVRSGGTLMNAPMNRRQFFKICSAGVATSSAVGLGLSPGVAVAEVRAFKLARTTNNPMLKVSVAKKEAIIETAPRKA